MARWQLQDAKNRFSQVVERALSEGPQVVTRRGREVVVIVSMGTYETLVERSGTLVEFLGTSLLGTVDLDLERDKDTGREVIF